MKDKSRFAAAREEKTENLFDCADLFPSDASNETSNDGIAVCSNRIERLLMADPYQVNSILAAVICEARGHHRHTDGFRGGAANCKIHCRGLDKRRPQARTSGYFVV